jgi:hypothetical protein
MKTRNQVEPAFELSVGFLLCAEHGRNHSEVQVLYAPDDGKSPTVIPAVC